ncbi:hypothetical protein BDV23DRAFT_150693 [Aspergillus alliaceus]|uniref:Uncharacterized protein n=1 Tax=Petromyces alliaceus TaxID=209559 RepID=A0A5N7CEM0_PETAA|nr:hypothetical protein BDV23DRAFT_150693 [Aspergillus alliaceus]
MITSPNIQKRLHHHHHPQSQPNKPRPPPRPFPFSPVDLTHVADNQQAIYGCLRSRGWNDSYCSWLPDVDHIQQSRPGWFRAKGWSEEQLRVFRERCERDLPVGVASPVMGTEGDGWGAEFDLQVKLLGEASRRKKVGEEMSGIYAVDVRDIGLGWFFSHPVRVQTVGFRYVVEATERLCDSGL